MPQLTDDGSRRKMALFWLWLALLLGLLGHYVLGAVMLVSALALGLEIEAERMPEEGETAVADTAVDAEDVLACVGEDEPELQVA